MSNAIVVDSLSFNYTAQKNVLEKLSLTVKAAQTTCLLGSNGAGKTTLINLILGRLKQQEGTISFFGSSQGIESIKDRIGVMMQDSSAPERAKVIELLTLFRSYYPQPLELEALIEQLQLNAILHQRFGQLSGGQKQLVLLALAICGNPDILFLDEPSVGMDVQARRTLWQVIAQYQALGKTIILTTHYLEEADVLADRIVVLRDGAIAADGTPSELKAAFSHKIIKAKTTKSSLWLNQLPDVQQVSEVGHYMEVMSCNATNTLKAWLAQDSSLEDFSVNSSDLEQVFLQVTQPATMEQAS